MNAYNEVQWIDLAISSVVDEFDEIVIVEGAYQTTIKSGGSPRSNDGTLEVLDQYKQRENVTVIHENEADHCYQNNKALEILKEKKVDWILIVDGDEVWEKNSLKIIKNYMAIGEKRKIYQYWVHFYNFVNRFDQYINSRMRRVYKLTPGCEFLLGNENMHWPDHGLPVDTERPVSYVSEIPNMIRGFHYTEIKPAKRWLLKLKYLKMRDNNSMFDSWYATEKGVVHDGMHKIKKFTKPHPENVRNHYLYKLWEEDPELLYKELFSEYEL
jgi:hypothetical protein